MKFITIALFLALANLAMSAPSCIKDNYCLGCDASVANKCTACHSWMKGTIGPKLLNASTYDCKTDRSGSIVADCKNYMSTTATTADSVGNNCVMCDGKDWLNYDSTSSPQVNTCSDTAIDATNCASTISDCEVSMCLKTVSGTKAVCAMCKSGYAGKSGAYQTNWGMFNACEKSTAIANCDKFTASGSTIQCYTCDSDYAVKSDSTSCVAFTTDSNCRQLNSSNACSHCWYSYYWDAAKCTLKANLCSFVSLVFAFLYINF